MKSIAAVAAAVLVLSGCTGSTASQAAKESYVAEALDLTREAVFLIDGTASSVSVTLGVGNETSQKTGVGVPMRVDGTQGLLVEVPPGTFLYVAAQNEGDSGSVECTIRVDGEVISTTKSDGAFVIATCSGTS